VKPSDSQSPSLYWPELDILRGIAAVLMTFNHLGYETLNAEPLSYGSMNYVVFIGSFAPVLFSLSRESAMVFRLIKGKSPTIGQSY
jgi:uncharacterized membrane protein